MRRASCAQGICSTGARDDPASSATRGPRLRRPAPSAPGGRAISHLRCASACATPSVHISYPTCRSACCCREASTRPRSSRWPRSTAPRPSQRSQSASRSGRSTNWRSRASSHAATAPTTTSSSCGRTPRELLPAVAAAYDEPSGDSSALPVYVVCRLAAATVKVVLSGEGGDELFGGYQTYVADRLAPLFGPVARLARPLVERLPSTTGRVPLDYKLDVSRAPRIVTARTPPRNQGDILAGAAERAASANPPPIRSSFIALATPRRRARRRLRGCRMSTWASICRMTCWSRQIG